jgi:hypothetical protein
MGNSNKTIKNPKLGSTLGSTLNTTPSVLGKTAKNTSLTGKQSLAVKMPKLKKPKDAFAPPSVFFGKSEDFQGPKHKNLKKLWDFINKRHKR